MGVGLGVRGTGGGEMDVVGERRGEGYYVHPCCRRSWWIAGVDLGVRGEMDDVVS